MVCYTLGMETDKEHAQKTYPEPPQGIRVLSNGAGFNESTKRIQYGPGTFGENPHAITSDNAKAYRQMAVDKSKKAMLDAILEQTKERGVNVDSPPEALGHAVGLLFREVLDGRGTLRDRNRVIWDIAKHTKLIEGEESSKAGTTNVQINLSLDVLREILDSVGGQVIDL